MQAQGGVKLGSSGTFCLGARYEIRVDARAGNALVVGTAGTGWDCHSNESDELGTYEAAVRSIQQVRMLVGDAAIEVLCPPPSVDPTP